MNEDGPVQMTEVWVRFQREGWHNWPDAPESRAYLRASHRHMFWYEVRVNISGLGLNRSLEFHDLLDYCRNMTEGPKLGANSCEMLAAGLAHSVHQWLQNTRVDAVGVIVTVSEDNECGATVAIM